MLRDLRKRYHIWMWDSTLCSQNPIAFLFRVRISSYQFSKQSKGNIIAIIDRGGDERLLRGLTSMYSLAPRSTKKEPVAGLTTVLEPRR